MRYVHSRDVAFRGVCPENVLIVIGNRIRSEIFGTELFDDDLTIAAIQTDAFDERCARIAPVQLPFHEVDSQTSWILHITLFGIDQHAFVCAVHPRRLNGTVVRLRAPRRPIDSALLRVQCY